MPSPTLFISYSSRSQASVDLAQELAHSLRNDGYEVFLDKDDLPAGESFDDRIGQAIARSDGMIFLAAPEALQPGAYTLTELGHAKRAWRSGRGRVLPVLLGDAPMERLDPYLRVLNVLRPVGNARAEVLGETRRLWPVATARVPSATSSSRIERFRGTRLVLSAALLSMFCLAAFLGFRGSETVWDATDSAAVSGRTDGTPQTPRRTDGTPPTLGRTDGTPLITGPADGTPLMSQPDDGGTAQTPELDRALALRDRVEPLLKLVRETASGSDYDALPAGNPRPATLMTVGEVIALQRRTDSNGSLSTAGAYQIIADTLAESSDFLGLPQDVRFSREIQDALAIALLQAVGLDDFINGRADEIEFSTSLARVWPTLPLTAPITVPGQRTLDEGGSYYQHFDFEARTTPERLLTALREVRRGAG